MVVVEVIVLIVAEVDVKLLVQQGGEENKGRLE